MVKLVRRGPFSHPLTWGRGQFCPHGHGSLTRLTHTYPKLVTTSTPTFGKSLDGRNEAQLAV